MELQKLLPSSLQIHPLNKNLIDTQSSHLYLKNTKEKLSSQNVCYRIALRTLSAFILPIIFLTSQIKNSFRLTFGNWKIYQHNKKAIILRKEKIETIKSVAKTSALISVGILITGLAAWKIHKNWKTISSFSSNLKNKGKKLIDRGKNLLQQQTNKLQQRFYPSSGEENFFSKLTTGTTDSYVVITPENLEKETFPTTTVPTPANPSSTTSAPIQKTIPAQTTSPKNTCPNDADPLFY